MSSNENRRISENRHWNNIRLNCKALPRLKSFFYFFDLEKGCRIIAGFEALVSVIQIFSIYRLSNQSVPSYMIPDPFWITKIDREGIIKRMLLYHTSNRFCMGLGLVTVLNSLLLLIGSKWVRVNRWYSNIKANTHTFSSRATRFASFFGFI